MKKQSSRPSMNREKICNICGEYCLVYTIVDNAPLCNDCVPVTKSVKKIMNEQQMINKILMNSQRKIQENLPMEIVAE